MVGGGLGRPSSLSQRLMCKTRNDGMDAKENMASLSTMMDGIIRAVMLGKASAKFSGANRRIRMSPLSRSGMFNFDNVCPHRDWMMYFHKADQGTAFRRLLKISSSTRVGLITRDGRLQPVRKSAISILSRNNLDNKGVVFPMSS